MLSLQEAENTFVCPRVVWKRAIFYPRNKLLCPGKNPYTLRSIGVCKVMKLKLQIVNARLFDKVFEVVLPSPRDLLRSGFYCSHWLGCVGFALWMFSVWQHLLEFQEFDKVEKLRKWCFLELFMWIYDFVLHNLLWNDSTILVRKTFRWYYFTLYYITAVVR